ncbi:hypothetical protein J3Q64DRAFT_1646005 [Phycomyces blakesleeanus]|uniref:Galactose oxidase n=1 Tax=Phycomyces blakesleeanus TaxID=4837 RepID=A0ABR3APB0_PHYBL
MCTVSNIILLPDNETIILFIGRYVEYKFPDTFQIYTYNLNDPLASWTKLEPPTGAVWPPARKDYSVTLAPNNKIYIYGGADMNTSAILNEMYSFDPNTNLFTNLTQPDLIYVNSHTAIALPNGTIVYATGRIGRLATEGLIQVPPDQVLLYDTNTDTWETVHTGGASFLARTNAGALLGKIIKTYTYTPFAYDVYQELLNDFYVLDTMTWTWIEPNITGFPPGPRNQASMAFVADDLLMIFFGQAMTISRNDFNILRFNTDNSIYSWLKDSDELVYPNRKKDKKGSILSTSAIVGISLAGVCVVLMIFCAFKFWSQVKTWPLLVYNGIIWSPRFGEPTWTEGFRLSSRCISLGLLAFYFAYAIREISDSTKATVVLKSSSSTIQSPDIRFCFDGWNNSAGAKSSDRPHLLCSTDEGYDCVDFVTGLDMSVHQPAFSDRIGDVSCFLFAPPKRFNLVEDAGQQGLGTTLIFALYGDPGVNGAIHTTIYPPGMDPNVGIYGVKTTDVGQKMSDKQVNDWIVADLDDRYAINVHSVYPKTVSTLSYQIQDHQYLVDNKWNKIGFLQDYDHIPEISTIYRPGVVSDSIKARGKYHVSTLRVFPNEYVTMISQEKAMSTVLNMIGSLGGVISLMAAVQLVLFGFRPTSPWGIVQRFAFGSFKTSIDRSLRNEFNYPYKSIPLVHRISNLHTKNDTVPETNSERRFHQIEERMQLMEKLLQAYYVDNEIFKELDKAIRRDEPRGRSIDEMIPDYEAQTGTRNRSHQRRLSESKL